MKSCSAVLKLLYAYRQKKMAVSVAAPLGWERA